MKASYTGRPTIGMYDVAHFAAIPDCKSCRGRGHFYSAGYVGYKVKQLCACVDRIMLVDVYEKAYNAPLPDHMNGWLKGLELLPVLETRSPGKPISAAELEERTGMLLLSHIDATQPSPTSPYESILDDGTR